MVQTILDLSEDVQHEEKLDQELLFNLLLLKEVRRGWPETDRGMRRGGGKSGDSGDVC